MGPSGAAVILIVTGTVAGGLLLVWVMVTAWRIIFPERPLPLTRNQSELRRFRTALGESVPVGFREIHEDMVEHVRRVRLGRTLSEPNAIEPGGRAGADEDLWERRN